MTAAIPTINSSERLPLVIELLRLQTVRPFIIVVDTGSDDAHWPTIEALRADDVEVHALRLNAIENSSEVVSMAIDTLQGLCRTRFLFCTHDDVFLRSRTALKELRDLAAEHPSLATA